MNEYDKLILRLAEINCANDLIEIGIELKAERKIIVDKLTSANIIKLSENGEFNFTGDNVERNMNLYIDMYNNW